MMNKNKDLLCGLIVAFICFLLQIWITTKGGLGIIDLWGIISPELWSDTWFYSYRWAEQLQGIDVMQLYVLPEFSDFIYPPYYAVILQAFGRMHYGVSLLTFLCSTLSISLCACLGKHFPTHRFIQSPLVYIYLGLCGLNTSVWLTFCLLGVFILYEGSKYHKGFCVVMFFMSIFSKQIAVIPCFIVFVWWLGDRKRNKRKYTTDFYFQSIFISVLMFICLVSWIFGMNGFIERMIGSNVLGVSLQNYINAPITLFAIITQFLDIPIWVGATLLTAILIIFVIKGSVIAYSGNLSEGLWWGLMGFQLGYIRGAYKYYYCALLPFQRDDNGILDNFLLLFLSPRWLFPWILIMGIILKQKKEKDRDKRKALLFKEPLGLVEVVKKRSEIFAPYL